MRQAGYSVLVSAASLWVFVVNMTLILGKDHAQPVAMCKRRASDNYPGIDALVLSPWHRDVQFDQLGDTTENPLSLGETNKTILDIISGIALALCVISLITLVAASGKYAPPLLITCTAGLQLIQLGLLIYLVGSIDCSHTGAIWGLATSHAVTLASLIMNPEVSVEAVIKGEHGSLYSLNF